MNDDPILSKGMVMMTIPSASGDQKTACLVSFHTYKKARKPDGYKIAPKAAGLGYAQDFKPPVERFEALRAIQLTGPADWPSQ